MQSTSYRNTPSYYKYNEDISFQRSNDQLYIVFDGQYHAVTTVFLGRRLKPGKGPLHYNVELTVKPLKISSSPKLSTFLDKDGFYNFRPCLNATELHEFINAVL